MTKQEFELKLGRRVTESDYETIEKVYTFHPLIDDVRGKEQIVKLFNIGGMLLINDMVVTARKAEELEMAIAQKKIELSELEYQYKKLRGAI